MLTRRRFLLGAAGLIGASALTVGYARYVEPRWVQVDEVALAIPDLPEQFAGTRLAQISDIHAGTYLKQEQLADAVDLVNQLNVAWLILTGDFVTTRDRDRTTRAASRATAAEELVEPLRRAQMPLYAVWGNHDLWGGEEVVARALKAAKVTVLRNEALQLGPDLWMAGVDDQWGGRPDLHAALREVPATSTTLLMSHAPDYFDTVLKADAPVAVQFSGHTHGGQVRLPLPVPGPDGTFSYAPVLPRYGERYPIGLRRRGDRLIYTNRGLGAWPIPYRLNCRPEITVFVLQSAVPGELHL